MKNRNTPLKGSLVEYHCGTSFMTYRGHVLSKPYRLDDPIHVFHGRMVVDVAPEWIYTAYQYPEYAPPKWRRTLYGTKKGTYEPHALDVKEFESEYPDARVIDRSAKKRKRS